MTVFSAPETPYPPHTRRTASMKTTKLYPNIRRDGRRSHPSASVRWRTSIASVLIIGCVVAGTVSAGDPKDVPICKLEDTGWELRMVKQAQYDKFIAKG